MNFHALFALSTLLECFPSRISYIRSLYSHLLITAASLSSVIRVMIIHLRESFFFLRPTRSFLPPKFLHAVRRHRNLAASGIRHGLHQLGLTGLTVSHQHWYSNSPGRAATAAGLDALARCSLRLVPVILEPDLHLGRRQTNDGGQVLALGRAQVTLLTETSLQLVSLSLGEQDAPLSLLVLGLVGLRRLVANLLLVLEVLRLLVLRRLVTVFLLRRERHVRDRRTRRVWLLEN